MELDFRTRGAAWQGRLGASGTSRAVGRTHSSFGGRRSCSLDLSHWPGRLEWRGGRQHPPGSRGSGHGPLLGCLQVGADGSTLGPGLSAPPSLSPTPALAFPLHASLLFSQMLNGPQATGGNQPMARVVQLLEAFSRGRVPDPMLWPLHSPLY